MARISHLVRIRAQREEVFRRIATTEGIAGWFTESSSPAYRAGGTLELRFPDQRVSFAVTELVRPSRVVWHCVSQGNPWLGTDVVFELVEEGGRTIVRFDHAGWPDVTDLFRDCSMSWAYFLESLRTFVEEGRGTPESLAPPCESELSGGG